MGWGSIDCYRMRFGLSVFSFLTKAYIRVVQGLGPMRCLLGSRASENFNRIFEKQRHQIVSK